MKTYSNLYDKCLDHSFIKAMILEAAKGKRKRVDVRRVLEKIDHYVDIIYNMLLTMTYKAHIPRATIIQEGTRPKKREIRKIRFFDQIIHHIVIKACYEVFTHGMYEFCCGSVPDRGIHYGKRYIERWIATDRKNTKYCCQMDIRHYFDSVDHEVLKRLLRRKITDKRMLWLLDEIIDSCETGIPLGYYTSQWFANFFLEGLDHYIKEQLHVKYYVRYLDDMVIFGRNKKELHRARAAIAAYLENNLKLQMKEKPTKAKKKGRTIRAFKRDISLWLFCVPGVILTFIFSYIPMYGVQIAFRRFNATAGITKSPWVGMYYFERFFNSPYFASTIKNTLILSLYGLVVSFPIPIILALMLNSFRHKRYRKVIQTVTYAPNFISTVVMCGMIILFLSPSVGVINHVLEAIGIPAVNFMAKKAYWRHIYVWTGVWQSTGWSSVIYFAALAGISPELHEAAKVDGATKLQLIRHIDLPLIMPTATILLIMNCGSILSVGFEKAFLLQNNLNASVSEIISTYVYKVGLINNDMSYSSAIGLFNTIVNMVMLIIVNTISDKLSGNSLW